MALATDVTYNSTDIRFEMWRSFTWCRADKLITVLNQAILESSAPGEVWEKIQKLFVVAPYGINRRFLADIPYVLLGPEWLGLLKQLRGYESDREMFTKTIIDSILPLLYEGRNVFNRESFEKYFNINV